MKSLAIKLIVTMSLLISVTGEAEAQNRQNCAPRQTVLERLSSKYGETRQSIGLGNRGVVMELFASTSTGTWTITVTTPDGLTCMIGAGNSYEKQTTPEPAGIRL